MRCLKRMCYIVARVKIVAGGILRVNDGPNANLLWFLAQTFKDSLAV
jgi:hypothetical protein